MVSKYFRNIYFTIIPMAGVGFTDQMYQFSSFYKLGLSLGYQYLHTPFVNTRSSANIYSFLGFNDYFSRESALLKLSIKIRAKLLRYRRIYIDFKLSDQLIQTHDIQTFKNLQEFINSQVKSKQDSGKSIVIVTFRLTGERQFLKLIHRCLPQFPDRLNLKKIYDKKNPPSKVIATENKFKILVHIRQGDTAIIETPWDTFIPLWLGKSLTELREYNSTTPEITDFVIEPELYYQFLVQLLQFLSHEQLSISIFSDGYQRGFETIKKKGDNLHLTSRQLQELESSIVDYDQQKFKIFTQLKNTQLKIGETEESLYQLIDASLQADIIVVGNQQRMIPKLIANYPDNERKKVIILLEKKTYLFSDFYESLGLDPECVKVIRVNLKQFSIKEVAKEVLQVLPLIASN